jgi:MscS family membrane protein
MRLIIFLLFISKPIFAYNLDSPRNTMKTFLNSMERFKLGDQTGILDAIETFNTSRLDPLTQSSSVQLAAKNLIQTLDKLEKIEFDKIPAKPSGDFWIYKRGIAQIGEEKYPVEISIGKTEENNWKFTPETLKSIGRYAQALKEEKTLKGITPLITASSRFRDYMPEWTGETYFLLLNGQWLGIIFILFLGFISGRIAKIYSGRTLEKLLRKEHVTITSKNKNNVYFSLSIIFASIIWIIGIRFLELEDSILSTFTRIGFFILSITLVLFSYYLVELIAGYFLKIAEQTENKFDDILVPILKKIAQFMVLVTGFVIIGESFGLNMRALIAGLGIGGLAFALAAKDSISNVFGSLMVLLDKPFEVGDFLKIDGRIEGKVESVGLRSTRLRTIQESQITIPNGILTNTHIDNFGRRLMRRFQTTIGIQYNTTPEKIEAFCEGIKELIVSNKVTYKEEFHVYLTSFAESALNIEIILFFEVPDFTAECVEKNRLLLDIIRLAKKLGVEFAYPTRTIYNYDMERKKLES